jgi:hypothetical protein
VATTNLPGTLAVRPVDAVRSEADASGGTCDMRLRLEEPTLVDDLIVFLDRCNCRVSRLADGVVEVTPSRADDLDVAGYLRVWDALHDTATIVIDDRPAQVA